MNRRATRGRLSTRREILLDMGRCSAVGWLLTGCQPTPQRPPVADGATWEQVLNLARGSTLRFAMWDGDPMINAYMRDYVAPRLRESFGLVAQFIGGQGRELVSRLVVDLEARRETGDIDLMWINGETFYQLRKLGALYGPFTQRLPNNKYVDWSSPYISKDFQQPVEGYECPWGNVQFAMIHNSETVPDPPRTLAALAVWIQQHPGRFTFDVGFTGMTFLKSLLYELTERPQALDGPFNIRVYEAATARLWEWLEGLRPHLWRAGETFPEGVSQLHQLFSNGEIDFTMSNNDGEVDAKVVQGVLPESARAYVFDSGTICNSHYVGIPVNAPNPAAALVAADFLISPAAQLQKAQPDVWGDGTVLSVPLLPDDWRVRFESIPGRKRVPPRSELQARALPEPAAEVMVRLHADFRSRIIERRP